MIALNKSVNLVVNPQSVDDMNNILKSTLAQHEEFYHVFKDFLKQTGRAWYRIMVPVHGSLLYSERAITALFWSA